MRCLPYQLVNAGFLNHQPYQVAVLKLPNGLEHRIKVLVDVEQKTHGEMIFITLRIHGTGIFTY